MRWRLGSYCAEANPSPVAVQRATLQVELAVARQPELTEAQLLLSNLYWSAGRLREAEAPLLLVAKEKPPVHLMLVNLCKARGDVAGARATRRSRTAARLNPGLLAFTQPEGRTTQTIYLQESRVHLRWQNSPR